MGQHGPFWPEEVHLGPLYFGSANCAVATLNFILLRFTLLFWNIFLTLRGLQRGGVKNRNKGGVSVCLRLSTFAHVCSRLLAFAPLRLLAFVCVCLRLLAFARICLRPLLLRPPLRDTDTFPEYVFSALIKEIDAFPLN